MSTQRNSHEPAAGPAPDDFAADGELFIRDLPSTATARPRLAAKEDDDDEDGIVTTMMLGEEGDRGGDKKDKDEKDKDDDEGVVTTMMLGEEGDRGGER